MAGAGAAKRISVIGGGAWGTALAQVECAGGNDVVLWARDESIVRAVTERHENPRYLPGIALDPALAATARMETALAGADCVLVAIPAQALRSVLRALRPGLSSRIPVVLCAKGIERATGRLPSGIAGEEIPGIPVAALSGPSFAVDVARGLPTAVTVAATDEDRARRLSELLSSRLFRCYSTGDLVGVEIGGALKNVLAIAAGIVAGRGLGSSAQAALITRGFVELRRIGATFGAMPETLMGLSGLGDLILTCSSEKSRNFAYGIALGRGTSIDGLPLAEGVATAAIAARLAARHGVDAPIIGAVDRILAGALAVGEAIEELLNRPLKSETD
jgi:glycerol-3-phosphate dehydrogenase (NAD(P)+)